MEFEVMKLKTQNDLDKPEHSRIHHEYLLIKLSLLLRSSTIDRSFVVSNVLMTRQECFEKKNQQED